MKIQRRKNLRTREILNDSVLLDTQECDIIAVRCTFLDTNRSISICRNLSNKFNMRQDVIKSINTIMDDLPHKQLALSVDIDKENKKNATINVMPVTGTA
jgi:hypothetical protein